MFAPPIRAARLAATTIIAAVAIRSPASLAVDWKFTSSLGLRATLTDNVTLAPPGREEADLYAQITPRIGVTRDATRLKAQLYYAPSFIAYASNSERNTWANSLSAKATLEAIQDFFFVDATANTAQTFLSPFGASPTDIGSITENRSEVYGASISPYIKGTLGAQTTYELRNRVGYTTTSSSGTSSSTNINWLGRVGGPLTQRSSWTLQANRFELRVEGRASYLTSIARAFYTYQVSPDASLTLRGGYEENNYAVTNRSGPIYGAGASWTPTPRTDITGFVEERFFGTGFALTATHRRRLTSFSLNAGRDISSFPQLLFTLPPGDTRSLLDAALTTRIPDPAQRQAAVDQFLQQTGSPDTLSAVTSYYSERINLLERISGSIALLGVRNSLIFSLSWGKSDPISTISGQPLPPGVAQLSSFTTYGGAINWSYEVTKKSQLTSFLSRYYSESNDDKNINTTNSLARIQLNTKVGPKTTAGIGARVSLFDSTVGRNYKEHAIFAVLNHQF